MATRRRLTAEIVERFIPPSLQEEDIRDLETIKIVLSKISGGIVALSSLYCRFISTGFPCLKTIDDMENIYCEETKKLQRHFRYIVTAYINSVSISVDDLYIKLLQDVYAIDFIPNIYLTVKHIHEAYQDLFTDIGRLSVIPNLMEWPDHYTKIEEHIKSVYDEIRSLYLDILYIFDTETSENYINSYVADIEELRSKVSVADISDIYYQSLQTCKCLDKLYKFVLKLEDAMGSIIDITDPMHVSSEIERLYDNTYNPEKVQEVMNLFHADDTQEQ